MANLHISRYQDLHHINELQNSMKLLIKYHVSQFYFNFSFKENGNRQIKCNMEIIILLCFLFEINPRLNYGY